MTTFEKSMIIAAIIAFVLLVIFVTLLIILRKRRKKKGIEKEYKKSDNHGSKKEQDWSQNKKGRKSKEIKQDRMEYHADECKGEPRLDGARVSHRRTHPERIAQEALLQQKKKERELVVKRQQEYEQKNNLQLVYSPCSGEVLYFAESSLESKKDGLSKPGVILCPSDDKIYAPMNGVITKIEEEKSRFSMKSDRGLEVVLQIEKDGDGTAKEYLDSKIEEGYKIHVGDLMIRLNQSIVKSKQLKFAVSIMVSNYNENQLLLVRKVNYITSGDKLITLKEDPLA